MAWWKTFVVCLGTAVALALVGVLSVLSIKAGAPSDPDEPEVNATIVGTSDAPAPPRRHPRGNADPGEPTYAAIAVNRDEGTYGYSYNFEHQPAAERRALSECAAQSEDADPCESVAFTRRGCVAAARVLDADGRVVDVTVGTARGCNTAQSLALRAASDPALVIVAVSSAEGAVP
ncbi:DUF4189 domain-containing protein [Nocardioides humilatus]|uniref:DUF4189 domain-containing protein n=1 Tax=Nocardioides humilatus TaxID=2607660 RepID=A0A5B1LEH9_9ACTN|nr:DUF4189 domain-containing protein [Nocardioides humilatus]KAA1419113.1 DUF4189 domain-containing protein [Nocardioides humilatus]